MPTPSATRCRDGARFWRPRPRWPGARAWAATAGLLTASLLTPGLATAGDAATRDPAVIRIGGSAWIMDAPTQIADVLGYFNAATAGSSAPRIEVDHFDSGLEALEELLAGRVDYALAAPTPVAHALLAAANDLGDAAPPIVVLASIGISSSSHYIIARRDLGFTRPKDLVGRRLGLVTRTSGHYGWTVMARLYGLDEDSVTLVDVPPRRQGEALLNGEIDAVLAWDPFAEKIRASLGDDAVLFPARNIYSPNWLLVSRSSEVRARPEVAERVVRGYLLATQLIEDDLDRAQQAYNDSGRAAGIDSIAAAGGVFWQLGLNWVVLAQLQEQFDWWRRIEGWPDAPGPHPSSYLHAAPLQKLAPAGVNLPTHLLSPIEPPRRLVPGQARRGTR